MPITQKRESRMISQSVGVRFGNNGSFGELWKLGIGSVAEAIPYRSDRLLRKTLDLIQTPEKHIAVRHCVRR